MLPFFQDISNKIPFSVDDLINHDDVKVITEASDNFVHKDYLTPESLNPDFRNFLEEKNLEVRKILVWHWLCKEPYIAHIDCNDVGLILPSALNWTYNSNKSCVNFYDMPDVDKKVVFGNQADSKWEARNVTAYIPIDVKGITPAAVWDGRGPAIINTSVPHLIVANEIRTSLSLQFAHHISIDELVSKF